MNLNKFINNVWYAFIITIFIIFTVNGIAQIYDSITIDNSGNISNIDTTIAGVLVFEDSELSIPLTQINWETIIIDRSIDTDSIAKYTFYMVNSGNIIGNYILTTHNWNSYDTQSNMILTWDFVGTLNPNESVLVTLTLSISPQIPLTVTTFSFDITIDAEKI